MRWLCGKLFLLQRLQEFCLPFHLKTPPGISCQPHSYRRGSFVLYRFLCLSWVLMAMVPPQHSCSTTAVWAQQETPISTALNLAVIPSLNNLKVVLPLLQLLCRSCLALLIIIVELQELSHTNYFFHDKPIYLVLSPFIYRMVLNGHTTLCRT